ncbi:hypothetical protein D3C81_1743650 [compost metagenome]
MTTLPPKTGRISNATASTPPSREPRVSLVSSPILLNKLATRSSNCDGLGSSKLERFSNSFKELPCTMKRLSTMLNSMIGLTASSSSGRGETWAPKVRRHATGSARCKFMARNVSRGARTEMTGTRMSWPVAGSWVLMIPVKASTLIADA